MIHKNFIYSTLTMASRVVAGLVLLFVLARYLNLKDFGLFTFALVWASMIVLIVEYGYNIKLSKDTAKYKDKISELTITAVIVKCSLLSVVIVLMLFIHSIKLYDDREFYYITLMVTSSIFNSFANHFLIPYRSIDRFDIEAKYVFLNNIILFTVVSIVAIISNNLEYVILSFVVVKFVYMLLTAQRFKKDFGFVYKRVNLINEYKNGLAFAIHVAVGTFYLNVDTVILKQYVSIEEVGIYQAGLKFLGAATILMGVLNTVLLPKLTQLLNQDKNSFVKAAIKFNQFTIFLGIFISVLMNVFDKEFVNLIFGKNFIMLVQYIYLFSIIVFLRYFGVIYGTLLTISDRQKIRTYGVIFTLFFIVVSDLFVIPIYKIYGALVVLIIAHILLNSIYIYFTYKEYGNLFIKNKD